jgi:Regulator of chromosome condensation (RCC1) repeat
MEIRKYFYLAVWNDMLLGVSNPKVYKTSSVIKASNFSNDWGGLVTETGEAYEVSINKAEFNLLGTSIKQISCNYTIACLISTTGQTFVLGKDPLKYGLLGIPDCYETKLTPILGNIFATGVSIGQTHAGLLDRNGNIYTWGSGTNGELGCKNISQHTQPTLVQSAKIFCVRQIICGSKFTAICTAGGFVYIYGIFLSCYSNQSKFENSPYSIKGTEKLFISIIANCHDFIACLTDQKDCYLIHGCLKPIKLPYKYKTLAGCKNSLYGISVEDSTLHEWKSTNESMCLVQSLEGNTYVFEEVFTDGVQIFSGSVISARFSSYLRIDDKPLLKYFSCLRLHQDSNHQNIGNQLINSANARSNALQKAIKISSKLVSKNLRKTFLHYRECISFQTLSYRNKNISQMIAAISKIFNRNKVVNQTKTFNRLLRNKKLIQSHIKSQKQKAAVLLLETLKKILSATFREIRSILENELKKKRQISLSINKLFSLLEHQRLECLKDSLNLLNHYKKLLNSVNQGLEKIESLDNFIKLKKIYSVIKIKKKVINQIISYTFKKNQRSLISKYFKSWARHRISSKIAEMSKKYTSKSSARGIAMKIQNCLRKRYKYAFNRLKECIKPITNIKYGLMFLGSPIKKKENRLKISAFKSIILDATCKQKFVKIMSALTRNKMLGYYTLLKLFLEERKQYSLLKICLKFNNLYDKFNYKSIVKSFGKLKNLIFISVTPLPQRFSMGSTLHPPNALKISIRSESSNNLHNEKRDSVSSPFSTANFPISPIPKNKSYKKFKASTIKNKKTIQNPKSKPKNQRSTIKIMTKKIEENRKSQFEALINKSFELEDAKAECKTAMIECYQCDFQENNFVKHKLGLASLEKFLSRLLSNEIFSVFSQLKNSKTLKRPALNFDFLKSSSSSDDESLGEIRTDLPSTEALKNSLEEISEDNQPKLSPWVAQLQTLAIVVLGRLVKRTLRMYFDQIFLH